MSKKKKVPREFPPKILYYLVGEGDDVYERYSERGNGSSYYRGFKVDGGWYSDKDAKPVPEKKIIEMRKELQAQMDYLNQFY